MSFTSLSSILFNLLEPLVYLATTCAVVFRSSYQREYHYSDEHQTAPAPPSYVILAYSKLLTFAASLLSAVSLTIISYLINKKRRAIIEQTTGVQKRGGTSIMDVAQSSNNYPDRLGITLGSVLGPLLLMVIVETNEIHATTAGNNNGNLIPRIYLFLTASLGFSFASSTSILATKTYWKGEGKVNKHVSSTPRTKDKADDDGFLVLGTTSLFTICIAFTIANATKMDSFNATGFMIASLVMVFYAIIEIYFLLSYQYMVSWHSFSTIQGIVKKNSPLSQATTSKISTPPLQHVFTFGEWITVSSFLSILLTDYVFRYVFYDYISNTIPSEMFQTMNDSQIAVGHAGLVGCFLGIAISISTPFMAFLDFVVTLSCHVWQKVRILSNNKNNIESRKKMMVMVYYHCALHFTLIVITILGSVDVALKRCHVFDDTSHLQPWCYSSSSSPPQEFILQLPILSQQPLVIPFAIRWLVEFLMEPEIISSAVPGTSDSISFWSRRIEPSHLPRYVWLLYWILLMPLIGFTSLMIARNLEWHNKSINNHANKRNNNSSASKRRRKMTSIARKFFHLVALVLFGPPTIYAPKMMSLSYAVATALLLVLERIRNLFDEEDPHIFKEQENNNDQIDDNFEKLSSFSMNDFYRAFFDEKDEASKEGGFVITHMALVAGCAFPLWVSHIITNPSLIINVNRPHLLLNESNTGLVLLRFSGILVLGIGDAVGAVVGILIGRMRWPGSSRTIEGSLGVLLSMGFSSIALQFVYVARFPSFSKLFLELFHVWLPLTLVEAGTRQIDNLCLPLMAVIFVLHFLHC